MVHRRGQGLKRFNGGFGGAFNGAHRRARSRAVMLWAAVMIVPTLAPMPGTGVARAEPYLAVRTGFKCSQCHVNRTGGGKRSPFGLVYSQTNMPAKFVRPPEGSGLFDGALNDFVSIGGNFRVDNVTLLEYESPDGERAESSNQLTTSEANVYVQVDLIPRTLLFYVDQTLTPSSANREFFGLLEGLPARGYVKIGRMLLPYGLRLLDDDAFIRNRTGYTYNRHDVGAEIGVEPGAFSVVANVTNTQFSTLGSVVLRRWRVGGSYGRDTQRSGDSVAGIFAGTNFGRFTLLGETDFITAADIDQLAVLAELDFLIHKGVNFKFVYEFFDRNRDVPNERDGQERYTVGLEPFVTQFLQVGLFYRINEFIPQNTTQNQDQLLLQFHVFF